MRIDKFNGSLLAVKTDVSGNEDVIEMCVNMFIVRVRNIRMFRQHTEGPNVSRAAQHFVGVVAFAEYAFCRKRSVIVFDGAI